MKQPDLNASGSCSIFTGFEAGCAFVLMDMKGLSGRDVGKAVVRCWPGRLDC